MEKVHPYYLTSFPKVVWDNFGEVLEGNLLPSLLQIPPLLPKNLKVNP